MEENQRQAYLYGAEMASEYLNEIGQKDLSLLTLEQILTFSECMCKNYHLKFIELNG